MARRTYVRCRNECRARCVVASGQSISASVPRGICFPRSMARYRRSAKRIFASCATRTVPTSTAHWPIDRRRTSEAMTPPCGGCGLGVRLTRDLGLPASSQRQRDRNGGTGPGDHNMGRLSGVAQRKCRVGLLASQRSVRPTPLLSGAVPSRSFLLSPFFASITPGSADGEPGVATTPPRERDPAKKTRTPDLFAADRAFGYVWPAFATLLAECDALFGQRLRYRRPDLRIVRAQRPADHPERRVQEQL